VRYGDFLLVIGNENADKTVGGLYYYPYIGLFYIRTPSLIKSITVSPVYKDHSGEDPKVVFKGRWSLSQVNLFFISVSATNKMWSLSTGGLCLQVVFSTGLTVILSCSL
jgi:hypothetical protein